MLVRQARVAGSPGMGMGRRGKVRNPCASMYVHIHARGLRIEAAAGSQALSLEGLLGAPLGNSFDAAVQG